MSGALVIAGFPVTGLPADCPAIAQADLLLGGVRHLGAYAGLGKETVSWPSPFDPLLDQVRVARAAGKNVTVLASGDPLWFGVGSHFAREPDVRFEPARSSFQLVAARLGWSLNEVDCFSLHGRAIDSARRWLQAGRRFIALGGPETAAAVAGLLRDNGQGESQLWELSNLGGADELITSACAAAWTETNAPPLTCIAVEVKGAPGLPTEPGLPDEVFQHDGQLTKRAVRALTVTKLAPSRGGLLWDVGAGCGSVAIEWLRANPHAKAIAFERDQTRVDMIEANRLALGTPHLQVRLGQFEPCEPSPTAIFIGGGLTTEMLALCWAALQPGGVLVANGVTTKSERILTSFAERLSRPDTLCRLAVEQAIPVGGFVGWKPSMTVTQLAAQKP